MSPLGSVRPRRPQPGKRFRPLGIGWLGDRVEVAEPPKLSRALVAAICALTLAASAPAEESDSVLAVDAVSPGAA